MGLETMTTTFGLEIVVPNLVGLAKLARVANPVGAFGAVYFYNGNASAGPYEEAMVNEINRSRANVKASIPSHLPKLNKRRKPAAHKESDKKLSKGPGKETGNGPGEDPMPEHLYYALMTAAGSPIGRQIVKNLPDFIDAWMPGDTPAAQSLGGMYGFASKWTFDQVVKLRGKK